MTWCITSLKQFPLGVNHLVSEATNISTLKTSKNCLVRSEPFRSTFKVEEKLKPEILMNDETFGRIMKLWHFQALDAVGRHTHLFAEHWFCLMSIALVCVCARQTQNAVFCWRRGKKHFISIEFICRKRRSGDGKMRKVKIAFMFRLRIVRWIAKWMIIKGPFLGWHSTISLTSSLHVIYSTCSNSMETSQEISTHRFNGTASITIS